MQSQYEYETVGKVDGLILKQFTVASLNGCGINPFQSDIQDLEGVGGWGGGVSDHRNHGEHIL